MRYYLNRNPQSDGYHEVQQEGCSFLPNPANRIFLGNFASCEEAMVEARKYFSKVDGCFYCSRPCHHR